MLFLGIFVKLIGDCFGNFEGSFGYKKSQTFIGEFKYCIICMSFFSFWRGQQTVNPT